jgi:hypothetical protein
LKSEHRAVPRRDESAYTRTHNDRFVGARHRRSRILPVVSAWIMGSELKPRSSITAPAEIRRSVRSPRGIQHFLHT